tara:strand:+ start:8721 stop:10166 length:1446 start_codon:yes stop_codon:yes gene_type:complete
MIKKKAPISINILLVFILTISLNILTNTIYGSIATIYDSHGTKSTGMGGTYTGIDATSESIFYNWSVPTPKKYLEWKFEQATKLETNYYSVSITNPFSIKNIRLGLLYSSIPSILETTLNDINHPTVTGQSFGQSLHILFSSYSIPNKWLNIGLRHTFYYEKIYNDYGISNQFDIAFFKPFSLFKIPINLGSTIHNISESKIKWSTNYNDSSSRIFSASLSSSFYQKKLLVATSKYYSLNSQYNSNRFGISYYIVGNPDTSPSTAIYAGHNKNVVTLGSSLNIDGLLFDYTWTYHTPFSKFNSNTIINEHRISIGKSFKPYIKIKQKNTQETTLNTALFNNYKKVTTIDTAIIANGQLILDFNNNECSFFLSHINKEMEHKFNGKYVVEEINYNIKLPIYWTIKAPDSNEVIMVIIEKTGSNKTQISGFLKKDSSIFINDTQLYSNSPDKSFYHKIDTSKETKFRLEIDILRKNNTTTNLY